MPEEDTQRDEQTDAQDDEQTDAQSGGLGEAGKRALDAERKRARAAEKELKELRAALKERDDKDKSDLERLQERADAAEKRAEAAQAKVDRFEVAASKGLTPAQARRLVGSTKEELEDDADAMRAELGLDKTDNDEAKDEEQLKDDGGRPKEKLRSGASNEEDEDIDPGKIADTVLRSQL